MSAQRRGAETVRLVFGLQPVREVIRAHGERVSRVLVERGDSPVLDALARFASDRGAKVERAARGDLDRLAEGGRHQGVAAYAPPLALATIDDLVAASDRLVLALDEIQDPQNFGALVRSAVALVGAAVLWPESSSAPLSPATFRASAGAIEHATLVRVGSLRSALSQLKEVGYRLVALDASGESEPLPAVDLTGPVVLIVGSEGKGLRKSVRQLADVVAAIPMSGVLDSLNASVAASIALYEARRQRGG